MPAILSFGNVVEKFGMRIDRTRLHTLEIEFQNQYNTMFTDLMAQVPVKIKENHKDKGLKLSRSDFVADILFTKDGFNLKAKVFTKTGKPSVSIKDHLPYFEDNLFVSSLMEIKKLEKVISTYVGKEHDPKNNNQPTGFWKYLSDEGRIHRVSSALLFL